jgi:hypothetical protein
MERAKISGPEKALSKKVDFSSLEINLKEFLKRKVFGYIHINFIVRSGYYG